MSMCPPLDEAASELLDLIAEINEKEDEPVSRWLLESLMEYGSETYDVAHLQELLGPSPRRKALYLHLGDLYDYYLVTMGPSGYAVMHRG